MSWGLCDMRDCSTVHWKQHISFMIVKQFPMKLTFIGNYRGKLCDMTREYCFSPSYGRFPIVWFDRLYRFPVLWMLSIFWWADKLLLHSVESGGYYIVEVYFAEYRHFCGVLLQKRPIIWRSLSTNCRTLQTMTSTRSHTYTHTRTHTQKLKSHDTNSDKTIYIQSKSVLNVYVCMSSCVCQFKSVFCIFSGNSHKGLGDMIEWKSASLRIYATATRCNTLQHTTDKQMTEW